MMTIYSVALFFLQFYVIIMVKYSVSANLLEKDTLLVCI